MGGEAETHRGHQDTTRGRLRRDGGGREGGRHHGGGVLPQVHAPLGQLERGPVHVGVLDLLHEGRHHEGGIRGGQHSAGHSAGRLPHQIGALHLREQRRQSYADTVDRGPNLC